MVAVGAGAANWAFFINGCGGCGAMGLLCISRKVDKLFIFKVHLTQLGKLFNIFFKYVQHFFKHIQQLTFEMLKF